MTKNEYVPLFETRQVKGRILFSLPVELRQPNSSRPSPLSKVRKRITGRGHIRMHGGSVDRAAEHGGEHGSVSDGI
ncbi:hypothetical protein V6N13_015031 [Hibiscus sabdariffa]|uniref:Uncharacterized protein n=1 Tax=Hibiscus sabdariffa TaxID=183260 RepID=A0ABR2RX88_9ROSI